MAEVLAKHQISIAWANGDERGITCLCGLDIPSEDVRNEIDMEFLAAHQAIELANAGYGAVGPAAAGALWEAAEAVRLRAPGGLKAWEYLNLRAADIEEGQ